MELSIKDLSYKGYNTRGNVFCNTLPLYRHPQSRKVLMYQLASSQEGDNTPIKSMSTWHIAVGIIDELMVMPSRCWYKHNL